MVEVGVTLLVDVGVTLLVGVGVTRLVELAIGDKGALSSKGKNIFVSVVVSESEFVSEIVACLLGAGLMVKGKNILALIISWEGTWVFNMLVFGLSWVGLGKVIGNVVVTEGTIISFEATGLIIVIVGKISFFVVGVALESNDSEMVGLIILGEGMIKTSSIIVFIFKIFSLFELLYKKKLPQVKKMTNIRPIIV